MQGSLGDTGRLQVLNAIQSSLSETAQDCLEALAGSAQALSLRDVSSAGVLLAAMEAVLAAQAAQDEEVQLESRCLQLPVAYPTGWSRQRRQ